MLKRKNRVIKVASYALQRMEDECRRLQEESIRLQAENDALRAAHDRAVEAAVALENEIARLKAEAALLEHQRNDAWDTANAYKEAWEALRWRIWILLKSTNVDGDNIFESDVRYKLADEWATIPQDAERK